jgi:hypothetical protein
LITAAAACSGLAVTVSAQVPVIIMQPQHQVGFLGSSVTFTVTAPGASAYQWLANGIAIANATSPSLTLTNLSSAQAAELYSVVVFGAGGSVISQEVQITSYPAPPSSTTAFTGLPFAFPTSPTYAAVAYAASGLPPGLSFNAATGVISGFATTVGTFQVDLAASTGSTVLTWTLAITVASPPFSFLTFAHVAGTGITTDSAGNVYITNESQNTVSKISADGTTVTLIAGTAGVAGGFDGPGSSALFNSPTAIAVDSSGNLYVADTGNSTIRKITSTGVVSTLAGFAGLTGYVNGTGSVARFNNPNGVSVDSFGDVYVSDTFNSAIRKITPAGAVTTIAGPSAGINFPYGIAIDSFGNLVVVITGPGSVVGGRLNNTGPGSLIRISSAGIVTNVAPLPSATFYATPYQNVVSGLVIDASGNSYVIFNSAIGSEGAVETAMLQISPSGQLSTAYSIVTGSGGTWSPSGGLAINSTGNLLLAGTSILALEYPSGPTITTQPQSQYAPNSFQPTVLTVNAYGTPGPLTYQWQFNGVNLLAPVTVFTGEPNSPVLEFPLFSQSQSGRYTVVVSTAYGSVISAPAVVGYPTNPAILVQPQSQTISAGGTVTLSVVASAGVTYQWLFNGANIAGATSSTLTLNSITLSQGGSYTVVVTAGGQSITSSPAIVQVGPTSQTSYTLPAPTSPGSINLGTTVTFTAPAFYDLSANGGLAAQANFTSFQWEKNGVAISGATAASFTISDAEVSDAGIYTVVAANNSLTLKSSGASLGVNAAPGATFLNSWSASTPLLAGVQYTSAAFDGSNFLVIGNDGSLFLSGNGATWSRIASAPGQLNSLIYAGPPYGMIGVGNNGVVVSFAGPTYVAETQVSSTSNLLTGVAVGGGRMVAVGYTGTAISSAFSTPGWVNGFSGTGNNLNAIAYGNGLFVAVGLGATILTSPDGLLWAAQDLGALADLYSVAFGPAGFVAIGDSGADGVIFTSPDGVTWTPQPAPATDVLIRVIYANNTFIAVGASGAIFTSTNGGFTWASHNSGTAATLEGVAFGLSQFVVAGSGGTITKSAAAAARLGNISTRAFVGTGSNDLIAGFVATGTGTKQVLIRGIGPALSMFDVSGVLADPQLTLFNGASVPSATNTGWSGSSALSAAFTQVGAFALPATSADTAILEALAPGSYTAQVSGANGTTGVALAEIYDADTSTPSSRLVNLSSRAFVGTGSNVLIAGFVVSGNATETVLIRGIGPGLSSYGLTGLLNSPVLTVYDSNGNLLATNTAWGGRTTLTSAFAQVGAFSIPANSNDTALLMALPPGNYSAEVSGANGTTGIALVELYEVQ